MNFSAGTRICCSDLQQDYWLKAHEIWPNLTKTNMQGDESSMLFELLTALIDLLIQVAEGLQVSCDVEYIFLIISDIQFISKTSTVI